MGAGRSTCDQVGLRLAFTIISTITPSSVNGTASIIRMLQNIPPARRLAASELEVRPSFHIAHCAAARREPSTMRVAVAVAILRRVLESIMSEPRFTGAGPALQASGSAGTHGRSLRIRARDY